MTSLYKATALLCAIFAVCSAERRPGQCPDFNNIDPFDVPGYLGRWFEIESFPAAYELDLNCVTADYGPRSSDSITIVNSGFQFGEPTQIIGNATLTGVSGQLLVDFPDTPPGLYNVLDTDYTSYASVYACDQIGANGTWKQELAWVLSRTEDIDDDTLAQAHAAYTKFGIDVELFRPTHQGGNCTYLPPPPNYNLQTLNNNALYYI